MVSHSSQVKALAASEGGFKDNSQLKEIRSDRVRWLHEDDSTVSALMEAMVVSHPHHILIFLTSSS